MLAQRIYLKCGGNTTEKQAKIDRSEEIEMY